MRAKCECARCAAADAEVMRLGRLLEDEVKPDTAWILLTVDEISSESRGALAYCTNIQEPAPQFVLVMLDELRGLLARGPKGLKAARRRRVRHARH